MNDDIKLLVSLIKSEESLLQEFLNLLDNQRMLLLENRHEDFEATVTRQERLLGEIHTLEQKRIEQIVSIAKGLRIEGEEVTLTRLIELSLGEFDEELRELKRSLNRLVERIKKANQVNAHLVHRSLNYLQKSVTWLIDSGDLSVTYSPAGAVNQRPVGGVLLNKQM